MILDNFVEVGIASTNYNHYKDLGYDAQYRKKLIVPIEHLTLGSHVKIKVSCDFCGKEMQKAYKSILKERESYPLDCCSGCAWKKTEITNQINYGVKNVMHLDENVQKIKETNLLRYGTEYPSGLPEIREKVMSTNIEKYGLPYYTQTQECKDRTVAKNLEKYGVPNYMQTEECKERIRNTNLERYGVTNPCKNPEIIKKTRRTCMRKYGVDNYFKSKEFKIQNINHNLKVHNVEYYSQTEDFKKKAKESWKKKTPEEIAKIKEKANKTMSISGGSKCSKEQRVIYEMLKMEGLDVTLNYPSGSFMFDILLNTNGVKIDIEYDGWYWHKDREKEDFVRDCISKRKGYKVLRIKSRCLLPDVSVILEAIDELVKSDRQFFSIKMDDWIEKEVG